MARRRFDVGHVEHQRLGRPAARANGTGRLFNFRPRARRKRHLRAGVRQRRGRRKPDTAPAAGDERAPAVEAEGRSFREVNRVCIAHVLLFPPKGR